MPQKTLREFICQDCNFISCNKKDFSRHLLTAKHKNRTFRTEKTPKNPAAFECLCGKIYSAKNSLWYHKQKCPYYNNEEKNIDTAYIESSINDTSVMMEIIKQNQDFKTLIIEQQKENKTLQKQLIDAVKDTNVTNNNITNNTTHNNNQKFNLNFFLNTTCKDAMNMSDFIENINVDFHELEDIGKNGYVAGMTNMILSRIKDMDITKRPLHCTDLKRETMYIKENNEWNKDTPDNKKLRNMVTIVANNNCSILPLWREKYPECQDWNNPKYEFSINMMRNVLGDIGEQQIKLDNKVIKNISKHILIGKNTA
tara:strand:- start:1606 stop:2541 length:936 start_codon:yes stop_codon:yes gene_type:complete